MLYECGIEDLSFWKT